MKNVLELSYLVPLFPLIGFLVIGLGRNYMSKPMVAITGCATILASFVLSIWIFFQVKNGNTHVAEYFNFISVGSLNGSTPLTIPFALQVDQLSSLFLLSCMMRNKHESGNQRR